MEFKYRLAFISGITPLVNHLNRHRPLIITYHGIYDGPRNLADMPATFVHLSDFKKQIYFLKSRYHFINPDEFVLKIKTGSIFPDNSALLTFDDGYESFNRLVIPIITPLQVKPIVFLPSKYIEDFKPFWFDLAWLYLRYADIKAIKELSSSFGLASEFNNRGDITSFYFNYLKKIYPEQREKIIEAMYQEKFGDTNLIDRYLKLFHPITPEIVKSLAQKGVNFGGHTHTHTILSVLPYERVKEEIYLNKSKIENLINNNLHFFAYPNGKRADFNNENKQILRDFRYSAAFSLTYHRSLPSEDPLEISRINVSPSTTISALRFHSSGISRYIGKSKGYID